MTKDKKKNSDKQVPSSIRFRQSTKEAIEQQFNIPFTQFLKKLIELIENEKNIDYNSSKLTTLDLANELYEDEIKKYEDTISKCQINIEILKKKIDENNFNKNEIIEVMQEITTKKNNVVKEIINKFCSHEETDILFVLQESSEFNDKNELIIYLNSYYKEFQNSSIKLSNNESVQITRDLINKIIKFININC